MKMMQPTTAGGSQQPNPSQQQGGSGSGSGGPNLSAADRSQRSVFVGNISYEANEDQLKEIFSKVGPVVHFRLVYDRDTGKPKGYGFCEYIDEETAQSAIRNLNGYDLHNRTLRVDSAAGSDRNKEEMRQLQMTLGGPQEESPYGPAVDPSKAPESISRAVASLPPEQMFELMKQMKLCIQNNPNEARNMLLQNPQLAYALLQAQVVMRIVDPQVAMTMLHRDAGNVPPAALQPPPAQQPVVSSSVGGGGGGGIGVGTPMATGNMSIPPPSMVGPPRMSMGIPPPMGMMGAPGGSVMPQRGDIDLRQGGGFNPNMGARGMGAPPPSNNPKPDDEKAQLIVQVLQLTDEQINLLPPEQKHSVLMLRDQLRNAQS